MYKTILLLSSVVLFLPACVQEKTRARGLACLEIGMTKTQVRRAMQSEGKSFGAIARADGLIQEVLEFTVSHDIDSGTHFAHAILTACTFGVWAPIWAIDAYEGKPEAFWMHFVDGKLTQYGRPQDWKDKPDHIQEYRIR